MDPARGSMTTPRRHLKTRRFGCQGWPLLLAGILASGLPRAAQAGAPPPPALPAGYTLLYEQTFQSESALKDFLFSDPAAWRVSIEDGRGALELHRQSQYTPPVRSPFNIALLANKRFGDFILEAEVTQTGREYGHRDMCFFFGVKDPANFYYAHLATAADDHAHNVFIVNDEPRVKLGPALTRGVDWGLNRWHRIRLERRVADGSIKVFFDDFTRPVLVATDKHFNAGLVGIGSFDDTGKVSSLRIWGPGFAPTPTGFFPNSTPAH